MCVQCALQWTEQAWWALMVRPIAALQMWLTWAAFPTWLSWRWVHLRSWPSLLGRAASCSNLLIFPRCFVDWRSFSALPQLESCRQHAAVISPVLACMVLFRPWPCQDCFTLVRHEPSISCLSSLLAQSKPAARRAQKPRLMDLHNRAASALTPRWAWLCM